MKKKGIISAVLAICLLLALVSPALAGGLTVYNGKIDVSISPYNDYAYTMKVQNTSDTPMDIGVEVDGYGTSSDRDFIALEPKDDKSPYTGRELLAVSPTNFHLGPGDSQVITCTAKIPSGIGDGGRYAIVFIHTTPPKDEMVTIISAIAARVLLTIDGSNLIHSGELTSVDLKPGKTLETLVTLTNTGNHHYKPHLFGTLMKGDKILATASLDSDWPVIPGYSRQFELIFTNTEPLPADSYDVVIEVKDDSGNLVTRYESPFSTEKPYIPPTTEVSTTSVPSTTSIPSSTSTLVPSATSTSAPSTTSTSITSIDNTPVASSTSSTTWYSAPYTLKTEDGRISISFPEGSVVSQTQVAIQSYPLEQVPAPPANYQFAATCFRIDGLPGLLLAKDATLKVQYNAADLEKAGGDAAKLVLARWDETANKWTVLKTSLDKGTMTLTTATDQFSIWSVMVGEKTSGVNWTVIISAIVGVTLICLTAFYVIRRKRSI